MSGNTEEYPFANIITSIRSSKSLLTLFRYDNMEKTRCLSSYRLLGFAKRDVRQNEATIISQNLASSLSYFEFRIEWEISSANRH